MTRTFRGLCMLLAVIMSAFCLTACSLFDDLFGGGGGDDGDEIEIVLSDDSDPFVIKVGQTITVDVLSPIGDPEWESIDESIATVTNDGKITGVAEGNTILVVVVRDYFASRSVVVMPADPEQDPEKPEVPDKETVTVSQTSVTIEVGTSTTLTAVSSKGSTISWSSLNQSIAVVNDGVITGLNIGTTTVIARSSTGAAAVCSVTVTEKTIPETVTLNRKSLLVYVGDTAELVATASKGSTVSWSSSNTSIATVSGGIITAKFVGKTVITASIPNGAQTTCAVEVLKAPDSGIPVKDGYTLTWNDEFNGNSLDTTKWGYQTGVRDFYNDVWSDAWYWGNGELQYYTNASKNVYVSDGALNIKAIKEPMSDGRTYSSGRILTRDKFSQTYGYFEARMKTPTGNGMWPAFWMLPQPNGSWGSNNVYGGWPHSGEIDIMEARGRLMNKVDHTIHFSADDNSNPHRYLGNNSTVEGTTADWHTYAIDWTPSYLIWYVDGVQTCRYNCVAWTTQASSAPAAPFDKPFYILFNLAVGGQYDNYQEPAESFTQATMSIDYIRVWQNNTFA